MATDGAIYSSVLRFSHEYMPDMMDAATPACHWELDDALVDYEEEQVLIVSPRGTAKSSLACEGKTLHHVFAEDKHLFELGLRDSPKMTPKFVVLVSKTQSEAKERLKTIKSVLGDNGEYSEPFRRDFGNWGEETARTWREDKIVLKDGTEIIALGTGQASRGLKRKHRRPTLIIVDDPEDENNTKTPEAKAANLRYLENSLMPALNQVVSRWKRRGRIIVIGTPIDQSSMVVELFQMSDWRRIWFRQDAERDVSWWYDSRTDQWTAYEGVLWPEVFPRERLLKRKNALLERGRAAGYYREFECRIVGDDNQLFLRSDLRYYRGQLKRDLANQPYLEITHISGDDGRFHKLPEPKKEPCSVFTGIDPAISEAKGADKTAVVNVAMTTKEDLYVLPYVHAKFNSTEVIGAIASNHKVVKPHRGLLEVVAAFMFIAEYLWRDHRIAYMTEKPTEKKKGPDGRIERLGPRVKRHQLWLMADQVELVDQLCNYPDGKDDLLDALEKAQRIATPPTHRMIADRDAVARMAAPRTYDPAVE